MLQIWSIILHPEFSDFTSRELADVDMIREKMGWFELVQEVMVAEKEMGYQVKIVEEKKIGGSVTVKLRDSNGYDFVLLSESEDAHVKAVRFSKSFSALPTICMDTQLGMDKLSADTLFVKIEIPNSMHYGCLKRLRNTKDVLKNYIQVSNGRDYAWI